MTFAIQYLRERFPVICLELSFACIFGITFWLYHLPLEAVLYPAGLCILLGCIFMSASMYHAYKKHKKLTGLKTLQGSILKEALPENATIEGRDYQQIIRSLCEERQVAEERFSNIYGEMLDYFTIWVHQIKTPIASMHLNLDAEDLRPAQRLKSDLLHIEQYVEMVLTYLKMGSESTDYVFRPVHLDKIVRENIRKYRGDFIMKKLQLAYIPIEERVISDEKWLSFVIGQLLSNALKYTNEGTVTISFERPKTLCICDTGIGIAPEDIPRVFEKGYTGSNGRRNKRASGLGLYLCKEICNRLGAKISITSEVEAGTLVKIDLSQNPLPISTVTFNPYKYVRNQREM